jgi:DNA-binding MurR/RpiR family transcriptional regulator
MPHDPDPDPDPVEGHTVEARIRARFDTLTRAERQLAGVILGNYPMSGLGGIAAVAEASGVSGPTVARMARKLGFSGFPDMQAQLRAELEQTVSGPLPRHDRFGAQAPGAHILNRFAEAAAENLRLSLTQIDPAAFDAAAVLLGDEARTVRAVGGRITRALAEYLITHLQVIRPRASLIPPNANVWPHHVLDIAPGDVLIAFDVRRYERDMERLCAMARERGAEVILITDQWGSPAGRHATHSFNLRIEVPSAWDSNMAPMFLVEALLAEVQTRTWRRTRARMEELEGLFDRTRQFKKFV